MIRKTEYQLEIILKIKELREANNVSQKELSNLLEVAPGLIGSIESLNFHISTPLVRSIKYATISTLP